MENDIDLMRSLDQFYTDKSVAEKCMIRLKELLGSNLDKKLFIEPSAGTGSFINAINKVFPEREIVAYDIDPKMDDIIKLDYLKLDTSNYKNIITIGNPPFGKRSKLALDFINKSMEYSDVVAFILPVQFNKWGTQRKINDKFKLIENTLLDPESFIFNGNLYSVRSTFQVWTKIETDHKDLRLKSAPPISHKDFKMWQYNNTPQALKYFDYDWDFAVPRQGYKDYNKRLYKKDELIKSTQYVFFKAKNKKVLNRLLKINFEELSILNTSTPGFGKADIVRYYKDKYDRKGE